MVYIFRHIIPAESYTFRHMPRANTYTFRHVTVLQSYTFRHIRPNEHGEIRRQRSRLSLFFYGLPCPYRSKKPPPRQGTACLGGGFVCVEDSAPYSSRHILSALRRTNMEGLAKLPFSSRHILSALREAVTYLLFSQKAFLQVVILLWAFLSCSEGCSAEVLRYSQTPFK